MEKHQKIDSLIFDMDGTLWDAVDSYAKIWNVSLDELGIKHKEVTRNDLLRLMGSYLDDILNCLLTGEEEKSVEKIDKKAILELVMANETAMMPTLGGILYGNVKETIAELAKNHKLFMVSNCGPGGLENFVRYNRLEPYFIELLSHGGNGKSKTENIRLLVEKHGLSAPVYVGDTQSDCDSAHNAGVPMIWAAYGFGKVKDADAVINGFGEISEAIEKLNERKI